MKAFYITFLNEDIRPGYRIKIHSQAECISEILGDCHLLIVGNSGFKLYDFRDKECPECNIVPFQRKRTSKDRNICDEFFAFFQFCSLVKQIVKKDNPDFVYIRRIIPITPLLLELLHFIKKYGAFIAYEYPTYPWEEEMKIWAHTDLKMKLFYFLDKLMYERLIKIPDCIPYIGEYYGDDTRFFKIQNCGSCSFYSLAKKNVYKSNIRFIGIAHVRRQHGYDILIRAIRDYYQTKHNRMVFFDIVGTVDPSLNLEDIVSEYQLEKYICFHEFQTGKSLDRLCDDADIGVNSLFPSPSKNGMTTLKTVEYTFRGLYQISSAPLLIDGGKTATPEFLYIHDNKSPLNIYKVLKAYDKCKLSPSDIRAYACEHMTWKPCMEKILNRLYSRDQTEE